MTEEPTAQEARYTQPVDQAEAEAWMHHNGDVPYPGLAQMSDEMICAVVFGAIRDGAPKNTVYRPWAFQPFIRLYQRDEQLFDELVIQPAYEVGVLTTRFLSAVQRALTTPASPTMFPTPTSATTLLAKTFPPLRCFVEELLAEGLTILAGKPKKGKSYLALDMSLSLAVGRQAFMHFPTEQARVLYVSLEDGERRLQRRLRAIQPNLTTPQGLDFLYAFPRLGAGALEALEHYAQQYQVIIIDVLGRLLPLQSPARKSLSEYQEITDVLGPIQQLALTNRMAIVLIDHVRKASVEDDGDGIIGSQGKFGVADHGLIYGRKGEEKDGVLKVISRDLEEERFVLTMTNGHLEYLGKGEIYELDSEQNKIIRILEEEDHPISIPDIMKALGIQVEPHYKRFRMVMSRLYAEDRIGRTKKGLYTLYGHDRVERWEY